MYRVTKYRPGNVILTGTTFVGTLQTYNNHFRGRGPRCESRIIYGKQKLLSRVHLHQELASYILKKQSQFRCRYNDESVTLLPFGDLSSALTCNHFCYTLRSEQNGQYFANENFNCIFLIEDVLFSINSIEVSSKTLFDYKSALVSLLAWHQASINYWCPSLLADVYVTGPYNEL